jgi:hypothetical protein
VDVHGFSDQIEDPVFLNAPLLVSSQLIARVIGERGVGDFSHKIDLSRRGMFLHPSLVKNDIRLGFVEILDTNWPSGAHSVAIVSLVAEDFGKGVDEVLVVISDGSHANDLAIKEFDSFFWPENAGLRHPVIVVDRKLPGSGFDGFGEKGLHRICNCAAADGRNPEQKRGRLSSRCVSAKSHDVILLLERLRLRKHLSRDWNQPRAFFQILGRTAQPFQLVEVSIQVSF